jgi:hypothetical protein
MRFLARSRIGFVPDGLGVVAFASAMLGVLFVGEKELMANTANLSGENQFTIVNKRLLSQAFST